MREILPGNPSDAGPDARSNEPPPSYDDLMMFAEEESCFARRRHRANSSEGRRQLLEAIYRGKQFFDDAERAILSMGVQCGPR